MNQVVEQGTVQYVLKSRVLDLPEGQFRGYVEVQARGGREMVDSRLKYCGLIRRTWLEAVEDAERLADGLRGTDCHDGECFVFSARSASSLDSLLNVFGRVR
ncbi:hypothetical protein PIGHUM_04253 [Pigmentiphaga humi]|uniref:Uncharacterized protein n=1 Tax=Pigmentiphaga humi TaxID=2478468 RepID=A0A3P4B790_9BURK|nr:hypothetical protein [Pigmentiphaga humi]VCU72157.1 hypothetical protein PIGHUM_04253 [Pigmentiphaga humi]